MSINVTCRDCKKIHRASSRLVGKTVRCPVCSRLLKVPASDSKSSDDPHAPPTPMLQESMPREGVYGTSLWTWRLVAAGIGVLALIIAIILAAAKAS